MRQDVVRPVGPAAADDGFVAALGRTSTRFTPRAVAADGLMALSSEKAPRVHLLLIMQVSGLE